jgi:hypothetical protein
MKTKLLASAGDQAGIVSMIQKYWFSKNVRLSEIVPGHWAVYNNDKKIEGFQVILKKNRYRFEGTI